MRRTDLRRVVPSDIDFLVGLARDKYPPFNEEQVRIWLQQHTQPNPESCFLRTNNGAALAARMVVFHDPTDYQVHMMFLVSRGPPAAMEGFRLFQGVLSWAREISAGSFHFGSQTGLDFSAYAKRVGAVQEVPSYELKLGAHVEEDHRAGP